jgi:hypothetical protein
VGSYISITDSSNLIQKTPILGWGDIRFFY